MRFTIKLLTGIILIHILPLLLWVPTDGKTMGNTRFFLLNHDRCAWAGPAGANADLLPKWPHEKSDLKPDPALVFGRLPNGFRYVLMKNKTPKDRVSLHLDVQAGSLHEKEHERGLAHFLEHMVFAGSTHFKPGELVKYFQKIGMEFGPDANAHTGFDETVYDLFLPEGNRKSIEDALVVLKDYAEGALLLPDEIKRERNVVLAEKRSRDSASYRTFVSTTAFEFPDFRISKRMPIGDASVLKKTTQKELRQFYDTWYRPETMILVMVGDVDISMASTLVEDAFASVSPRTSLQPAPDMGEIRHRGIKSFYHFEREAGKTTVTIEVLNRIEPIPDSVAFQKQMAMKMLSDRMVRHRLDALQRKPDAPFTSASIESGYFLKRVAYAEISAQCNPDKWIETLTCLEQVVRQAILYGFHDSELRRVKADFLSELDTAVKQAPTRESTALARDLIRNLNNDRVFMSPDQERALFAPMVRSFSLETAHGTFRNTWEKDHRLILVTGNAELSDGKTSPEEYILNIFKKSTAVNVSKPERESSAHFPYLPDPEATGEINREKIISDLGIIQVDFKNGVRLNCKKTLFKANDIRVLLSFGRGKLSEPESKPGLSILGTAVVNESGLGALDKEQLDRALAGKNTDILFGVDEDGFFLKGRTIPEEIQLLFQLLYAYFKDPAFREDAFALSMERFGQRYQSLTRSIEGAMALKGDRFLAGGDSRFGLPSLTTFNNLTLEDVRKWVGDAFKNGEIELSVVGDVDVDTIINLASGYLGTLPKRKGSQSPVNPNLPRFPVSKQLSIEVDTKIPKGMTVVAYPSTDIWDISRTRRLSILSQVFSERLRLRIREKLGATYSPFAFNRASKTYPGFGIIQAYIQVDPKDADWVITEVLNIASELAKNGIEDEELRQSLDPTLVSIKDQLEENAYWLETVLCGSKRHPQQIDWCRTIMNDYAAITSDDVGRLARTYLDRKKAASIKIVPVLPKSAQ